MYHFNYNHLLKQIMLYFTRRQTPCGVISSHNENSLSPPCLQYNKNEQASKMKHHKSFKSGKSYSSHKAIV